MNPEHALRCGRPSPVSRAWKHPGGPGLSVVDLLVIEPSVSMRKMLERLLESNGYTMRGVMRGEDAAQQIRRQRPDLILSEVNLPGGGGLEWCQQFCLAGLSVLLMSADVTAQLERDSQNAGALELLSKPLAEGTLLRRLAHHLKLPAPAALPRVVEATSTLLGSLMTRPGILGTVLLGPRAEMLEHLGSPVPEALYLPFLTLAKQTCPGNRGTSITPETGLQHSLQYRPFPDFTLAPEPSSAEDRPAGQVQIMQLDYPGNCLLLFRLPAQAACGQRPALEQSSTLICMVQNSSYASLIKYHLRSSPYIRL